MTAKLRGLQRLATLYRQVEQIRSAQLRAAASAVDEVLQAKTREEAARQHQAAHERAALMAGDREGWVVAAVQAEAASLRQRRLGPMRQTREAVKEQAAAAHQASRIRMEQIDAVIDKAVIRAAREEGRRSQLASDDRFLSRRVWLNRNPPRQP